jgi:hypothetical protein
VKTAGAIFIFVAASVSVAVGLAFPFGGLSPSVAWAAFAAGIAAAFFAWRGIRAREWRPPTAWDVLMLTVFALASLRAFLWLLYPVGDEWRVLSPNNLGDISLHIQMIRYLAGGVDFWPASPILAGAQLTYPLGVDLFNSLLLCAGVPLEKGLIWIGLLGAGLSGWALWRWGGAFAVAALLFNGGLAGFLVFQTGHISDFQTELPWKNFFLAMFVTQRGLLYALPCGLFLLSAWREDLCGTGFLACEPAQAQAGKPVSHFRASRDRQDGVGSGVPRWVAFLLYATMPLFSAHAFVFLSFVLACAFLVNPRQRKFLAIFVACAIPPATASLFYVTGHFAASSGLRWLPGWMQKCDVWLNYANNSGHLWLHDPAAWIFWIWNFGVSLPLLLLLGWRLIWTRRKDAICFAGTGIFVFLVCCFVSFAPWEWDNTKLFLWAWLACAPFLWEMISKWPVTVRGLVCFVLFFSGAVSLVGGLDGRHGYKLTTRSELAGAAVVLAPIPFEDRIAVEPDFNNPVMLLGRPVLCGYEGHLWSHGLDYHRQWDALHVVLKQEPGWQEALKCLDAKWLYLKASPPFLIKIPRPDYSPNPRPASGRPISSR